MTTPQIPPVDKDKKDNKMIEAMKIVDKMNLKQAKKTYVSQVSARE